MHALPVEIKKVWYLVEALWTIFALLVAKLGFWLLNHFTKSDIPDWVTWIVLGVIVVWTVSAFALVRYRYSFYRFAVNATNVEIRRGFFFRRHTAIPINRIQNIDLDQGPLLRLFHLQKIRILTGGSGHEIEALPLTHANDFKNQVMTLAKEARHAR
ncbi:PH domain-containing protein [Fructobacillus ficulneus]|uniref:YdbS-like PH domain-containing protein n=1 Tax=Fructobacillus ficulneus TaxID=157463 RepID=A0A0K8MI81_9LACO|nr:PH domain-containing protein [Fructobacillus ficulneus]GAP00266.1 hypothetical protein FFIC_282800 [Fructobacillus ficulneus]